MYQTLAFGCCERFQKAGAYDRDLRFTFQDTGRRTLYARCGDGSDQKNVRVVRWRVKDEETFYEMLWS